MDAGSGCPRILALALLLVAPACSQAQPESPGTLSDSDNTFSEQFVDRITRNPSTDFEVMEVLNEMESVRVNIRLTPASSAQAELKRRTLNALYSIQSVIGKDHRLSVWTYSNEASTTQGMAFYSPLTESYVFKSSTDLEEQ
jgi:hypothetical protein